MKKNIVLLLITIFFMGCTQSQDYYQKNQKVKNVIFIIGDGMGPQQISLLQMYAKHANESIYKNTKTNLEKEQNLLLIHLVRPLNIQRENIHYQRLLG